MNKNKKKDKDVFDLIKNEHKRQRKTIELIASENFVSKNILKAQGSILTNKYAEGYPNKRYYGGCEHIDQIEQLAISRVKALFGAEHANVQPHSGSQANAAAYMAVLEAGDTVLAMSLSEGGHLTHGHDLNFSGELYNFVHYGVDKETGLIDYYEVLELAKEFKPRLIVAGASAYSREIDFKRMREIADEVGAVLMVDMAHIAGIVAAGLTKSPVPYADIVTSTTHKTLRGPRGGLILCKKEYAKVIDRSVFPGTQGGPLEHIIAAKAICFREAQEVEFKEYIEQVLKNAVALSNELTDTFKVISGGTSNHLLLVDVSSKGLTGKKAEEILDSIGITCNKNTIPYDKQKPFITSGVRLGTAAMTTKGFKEEDFVEVGKIIKEALSSLTMSNRKKRVLKRRVAKLTRKTKRGF